MQIENKTLQVVEEPIELSVICVDDDPEVTDALRRRFQLLNVTVHSASDGAEGVWLASSKRPDVVIADISMPGINGIQLVECLKANPSTASIPIFILSGRNDKQLMSRLDALGVNRIFHKPADLSEILLAFLMTF